MTSPAAKKVFRVFDGHKVFTTQLTGERLYELMWEFRCISHYGKPPNGMTHEDFEKWMIDISENLKGLVNAYTGDNEDFDTTDAIRFWDHMKSKESGRG